MKVEEGKYSIAEIVDWFKRKDLVVNTEYQRGGGLWPPSAKVVSSFLCKRPQINST